jgi:hypothetical protein
MDFLKESEVKRMYNLLAVCGTIPAKQGVKARKKSLCHPSGNTTKRFKRAIKQCIHSGKHKLWIRYLLAVAYVGGLLRFFNFCGAIRTAEIETT